ncbi:hypothetical protein ABIF93_005814 [Bradyrhizobium japonicum]
MDIKSNSQIPAEERAAIFHEQYGNDGDAAATLADIVTAAGNFLTRIVGKEEVDAGMARMIAGVLNASGGKLDDPSDWREALDGASSYCYSEWVLGTHLHDLAAYALYGIVLDGAENADEREENLERAISHAEQFLLATPASQWNIPTNSDLHRFVLMARNRWALDHGKPIEPAALAVFGGVSEGRIRNMMSGEKRIFSPVEGKIHAQEALAWLSDRPEFWNSIWREQALPQYAAKHSPLERAVFVPVARDDSTFHPGLKRGAGYTIGAKGSEIQVVEFEEALGELQRMPIPYWRRPNAVGNWGTVSGVRWARLDAADLEILANNPNHRIPDNGRA